MSEKSAMHWHAQTKKLEQKVYYMGLCEDRATFTKFPEHLRAYFEALLDVRATAKTIRDVYGGDFDERQKSAMRRLLNSNAGAIKDMRRFYAYMRKVRYDPGSGYPASHMKWLLQEVWALFLWKLTGGRLGRFPLA